MRGTPLAALGQQAALWSGVDGALLVVDATDAEAPRIVHSLGMDIITVEDLQLVNGFAIASLGLDGVVTLPLEP